MEEDTEYTKLPIEERCVHKLWKARVDGYEAAKKLFSQIDDEKSPEWNKYASLIKKFVVDANAVAQEKGLEAALAFVENAKIAAKNPGDVISGVIDKALAATKARTRELAIDILLMYVEIERHEIVLEELLSAIEKKTAKALAVCVQAVTAILRAFGPKVLILKPLFKQLPKCLENRDKLVRDEAKALCVELHRWVGAALKPHLHDLKPILVSELQENFKQVADERPQPTRYLRSEQEKISKAQEAGDAPGGTAESKDAADAGAELDPYEFIDPVDILSKLPKDFFEKAEAKKWQERKEALEVLMDLVTKNPKLETGDYGDIVKLLKKVIGKDTNVMLVALGAQCLSGLAKGLKKKFHPYAASCLPVILEKFKEKKAIVVTALREVIDSITVTLTLESFQEDVCGALDNKNPSIKAETASFLARFFARSPPTTLANKKILKLYITPLMKTLNESDPQVRDNSAEALGTVLKVAGEKLVMPFMADVDPLRMAKVKEFADKVEVKGKPAAAPQAPASAAPSKSSSSTRVAASAKETPNESPASSAAPSRKTSAVSVSGTKKPVLKKKPAGGASKPAASAGGKGGGASDEAQFTEKEIALEEAEMAVEELLPADVLKGLIDGNWKTRLAAIETFHRIVSSAADPASLPAQALILIIRKPPGLKDNNFQVMKLRMESIKAISAGGKVTRTSAGPVIPEITDKLGDPKCGVASAEALTAIAESRLTGGLSWVGLEVLKHASAHKNPKVHTDGLNWLNQAVKEFGFNMPLKPVIEMVKTSLAASQAPIRQAAVTLVGTLSLYIGRSFRSFFEDRTAQILQNIDDELKKLEGVSPPAPTRGLAPGSDGSDADGGEAGGGSSAVPEINPEDLLPRVDIADQITPALLEKMADKNWKTRAEGLNEVKDIVGKAKFITPNIGELPTALKARVADINKNLTMEALGICKQLAEAMGSKSRQHSRIFIPAIIGAFSDNKPHVRAVAKDCLDAWEEKIKLAGIFEGEMIAEALKLENPYLRTDLLAWLKSKMPEDGPIRGVVKDDVNACLQYLCLCLEDRNADVRKNAQEVFFNFMIQVGVDGMIRMAGRVKPASKNGILALVEKYKPQMPVKAAPPPPPPSETKSVRGGGGKSRSAASPVAQRVPEPSIDDEEIEEHGRGSATATKGAKSGVKAPRQRAGMSKPTTSKKKDDEVDLTPFLAVNNLKNARFTDEAKLKVLKWSFTAPREEFVEQLREQFAAAGANQTLVANLFSPDFKMHIKALDCLMEMSKNVDAVRSNLDLILKWLTLRFFETNPSVIIKGLEFVQVIFDELTCESYAMHDLEVSSFLPYLLIKIGDPKEPIRNAAKRIVQKLPPMYPAPKLFNIVMDGLKSKNSRQRAECLEEMGCLIANHGLKVCGVTPTIPMKEMAKQISDRDNTVRNAALNAVVQAYFIVGEKIFKMVGPLADKDMSMLEERIKRAQKSGRPPGAGAVQPEPAPGLQSAPSSPAGHTDLNATRVTGRAGSRRPASAYYPSQQSPVVPGRGEKHLSPPASSGSQSNVPESGAQSRVTRHMDLDFKALEKQLRPEGTRLPRTYPQLTEIENFNMSMSVEVRTVGEMHGKYQEPNMEPNGGASGTSRFSTGSSRSTGPNGSSAVNGLIKEMACPDAETSRRAMCTMLAIVKTKESHEDVKPLMTQIVIALNLVIKRFLVHERPFDDSMDERFRQDYVHNVVELVYLFALHEDLIPRISEAMFGELLRSLLLLMVEPRITNAKETLRYLNKFFSHSVKNSEPTIYLCASLGVFRVFLTSATDEPTEQKQMLVDIVMRLLWRIVRDLPQFLPKYDCEPILKEINEFFSIFPRDRWLSKSDKEKLPVKTVKTVLTHLCKARLSSVLACYRKHPEYKDTDLGRFIDMFERERRLETQAREGTEAEGKLSRHAHEELTVIFQKIGDKDESEEGIRLLHAFRERHPEADLEPFLIKSSQFFQQYIESGLERLDEEKRLARDAETAFGGRTEPTSANKLRLGNGEEAGRSPSTGDDDPLLYMDRLKRIRERFGLPLGSGQKPTETPTVGLAGTPLGPMPMSPFSPDDNGSRGSSAHGSPGDENRDIVTATKVVDVDDSQPRPIPDNISNLMKRFNQIKRGELN